MLTITLRDKLQAIDTKHLSTILGTTKRDAIKKQIRVTCIVTGNRKTTTQIVCPFKQNMWQ